MDYLIGKVIGNRYEIVEKVGIGNHDPLLDEAILPDCFIVDHVRVFDAIEE